MDVTGSNPTLVGCVVSRHQIADTYFVVSVNVQ